ncbi:MAG: hypothetical protein U0521_11915 [Anaerolineae bacterium]
MLMNYSRHLGPVPSDWNTNVHVVGTWNLPTLDDWTPPDALRAFLAAGEPPVFFGFGSMKVSNPAQTTRIISEALRVTNLRGVLQSGWSGLAHEDDHLITIDDTPHDWLFPQMAAIVHHGGSGTTSQRGKRGQTRDDRAVHGGSAVLGSAAGGAGVGVPPDQAEQASQPKTSRRRCAR